MKKIFLVFAAVFCWAFQVFSASFDYSSTTNLHTRTEPVAVGTAPESFRLSPEGESRGDGAASAAVSTNKPNYINTAIYNTSSGNIGYWKKQFFDGLGAPLEDVYVHYAPALKDLVTLYEYDSNGRPNVTWLPISTTGDDEHFVEPTDVKSRAKTYYKDTVPYREVVYKNDPLDQVVRQFNAGSVFKTHNKFVQTERSANTEEEVRQIVIDEASNSMDVSKFYPARTILVTTTTNEDGVMTRTYTDKSGRVVMTSVGNAKTYYGYNTRNLLTIVITPEGSANFMIPYVLNRVNAESVEAGRPLDIYKSVINMAIPGNEAALADASPGEGLTPVELSAGDFDLANIDLNSAFVSAYCYKYRYDGRGNVIERKFPGRVREELEYNDKGLLTTRFRGKLDASKTLEYADRYQYDNLNRLISVSVAVYAVSGSNRFPTPTSFPMIDYQYDDYAGVPYEMSYRVFRDFSDVIIDAWRTEGLKTYEKLRVINELDQTAGYVERAYYYDSYGRVIQMVERNHLGGISYFNYAYDFMGNVILRREQIQVSTLRGGGGLLSVKYTFDNAGRPNGETYTFGNAAPVEVSYAYNELGQNTYKKVGPNIERYKYNVQGWLTEQTSPTYSAVLRYYDPALGTKASYTGNIAEWDWMNLASGNRYTYAYSYDGYARLTGAELYLNNEISNTNTEKNIAYDLNGNIKSMKRMKVGSPDEDMAYVYMSGILKTVSDQLYLYDNCGNTTYDGRNNLDIKYNFLNLPMQIKSRSTGDLLNYTYLADGTKFSCYNGNKKGLIYIGSFVFKDMGELEVESCSFNGGRFVSTTTSAGETYKPQYYMRDHLGSVRVITDETGSPLVSNHYYPSGKRWGSSATSISTDRYRFNGKEEQWVGGSGLLDYGARFYNPDIARWLTQDPLAEKHYGVSPYAYVGNNPIRRIDPDGRIWVDANGNRVWDNNNWTKYATPEMRELGNTLRSTKTGAKQFEKLVSNPAEIKVIINDTDTPGKYGHMNPKGFATKNLKTGIVKINSGAEIVIYKQNAKKRAEKSEGRLTTTEAMAVNAGHEIEHTTDENITLSVQGASKEEVEKKPNEVSQQLIREYEMQKPIIENPNYFIPR